MKKFERVLLNAFDQVKNVIFQNFDINSFMYLCFDSPLKTCTVKLPKLEY